VLTKEMKSSWRRTARLVDAFCVRAGLKEPGIDFWFRPEWGTELARFAGQEKFDTVVVEYVFFSKALECFGANTRKVIDTHDNFSRRGMQIKRAGIKDSFFRATARTERIGLLRADIIMAIQDREAAEFEQLMGGLKRVVTVGHWTELRPVWRKQIKHPVVGYLGSGYKLNKVALEWFTAAVWPIIKKLMPEAVLRLGGGICDLWQASDGIELTGHAEHPGDFYAECQLVINPATVGSGLKIKTIEALGYGMPLVTTRIGAEGLETGADRAYLSADDPASFADAVIKILSDQEFAARLSLEAQIFTNDWNKRQKLAFEKILNPKERPGLAPSVCVKG
jgi:glycosyltransferase involved in cell wall biosynthesis